MKLAVRRKQIEEAAIICDQTSTHSTYFEKLTEHIFISELLQEVLLRHEGTGDVLRSEIDSSGYDLALECNGILRYL